MTDMPTVPAAATGTGLGTVGAERLTAAKHRTVIDQVPVLIDELYVHLPPKRAMPALAATSTHRRHCRDSAQRRREVTGLASTHHLTSRHRVGRDSVLLEVRPTRRQAGWRPVANGCSRAQPGRLLNRRVRRPTVPVPVLSDWATAVDKLWHD